MDLQEYVIKRNEIITNFSKKSKLWKDDVMVAKFNIVSACLSNYLPNIHHNEHEQIFRKIFLHQQLSIFEQSFYDLPDYIVYENLNVEIWDLLRKRPSVICTFHTGSYRLINLFLAKNKIPYSLVITSEVIQGQGDAFREIFKKLNEGSDTYEKLNLIDASSSNSALQMIKELKKGRHLVVYIDGNSGAGKETIDNNNNCEIDFLNRRIFARQGVGFLSHVMQIPILTVASYRKSLSDIRLKFFDPLFSDAKQDRAVFAKKTTQHIFDLVAPIIKEYPEQWEAWLYLHKVADTTDNNFGTNDELAIFPNSTDKLRFNSSCFGIFKIVKETFLFQKSNYKSYKISDAVYNFLTTCITKPVVRNEITIVEFAELYKNKVLVCA
jgi:lauroyl/myristoyl acyltransferase